MLNSKLVSGTIFVILSLMLTCKPDNSNQEQLRVEDIFKGSPEKILAFTKSYESNVSAQEINDMNEHILCMSTTIDQKSNTYFIQPDQVDLKELSIRYQTATVVDMKTGLLIKDNEAGKSTLFYLPGKFPIDSLRMIPDVIVPVLGITRYQSAIEKISSRWTDVVCKCIKKSELKEFVEHSINDCTTGGPETTDCILSNEGSVLTCQTDCREGAVACCWFEF